METIKNNYFIKTLESGNDTHLMLMSHNAYWSQFTKLEKRFNNFHIYIFGSSTSYTRMRKNDIPKDCDFILLDGSDYFSKNEMNEIKRIGQKISEDNNKRVTIGYVYFISQQERIDPNSNREIKIISIKNNLEDEETISIEDNENLLFFAGLIAKKHDELEDQQVLKKSNLE